MGPLSWLIVGLLAGAIGKALYPGYQGGGILGTLCIGVLGAIVGGWVGSTLFGVGAGLSIPGLAIAVMGAIIVLFIYYQLIKSI